METVAAGWAGRDERDGRDEPQIKSSWFFQRSTDTVKRQPII